MNDVRGKNKMSHDAVFFQRRRGGKLFDPACGSKISDLDGVSFDGLRDAPGASLINPGALEQPDQPSYSSVCLGRNDSDKLLLPTTIRKERAARSGQRSESGQYGERKVKQTMLRFQSQPIQVQLGTALNGSSSPQEQHNANFISWLQGEQTR